MEQSVIRKAVFLLLSFHFSNPYIRKLSQYIITVFVLYGLTGGLFSACTENEDVNKGLPEEMVVVDFTMSKVDYVTGETEGGRPAGELRSGIPADYEAIAKPFSEEKGASIIRLSDDLYMAATLVEEPAPVSLRSIPLEWDSQVRIVAYTGTTYIAHADYKVASTGALTPIGLPLRVTALQNYRFVAYSFHNNDPLDTFAETTALFEVSDDLLWGYYDKVINTGNETVHITMNHLFSKVKLDVRCSDVTIDAITGAQISTYDSCRLVVNTGQLTQGSGAMETFPFVWSSTSSSKIWTSNELLVHTNGASSGVEISSITIGGAVYPGGPYLIPYSASLLPGKSYTLRVRLLRQADFAPRITWDPVLGRYAITYDPTNAGLYFKFGSTIGIYSGDGQILTLPPASIPGNYNAATSIPWRGTLANNVTWANIPISTSASKVIDASFHRGDSVKTRSLGDPCRMVGVNMADIMHPNNFTPVVDGGVWRLPTAVENQAFANASEWQKATTIYGRMFTPLSSMDNYFLPAAGYRTNAGSNPGQSAGLNNYGTPSGLEAYYQSNTPSAATTHSALQFTSATLNSNLTTASKLAALPVRCVYDPRVIFEARPWEYEREYLDPISSTYQRQDSYLLNGSTYKIKTYGNSPWRIKSITQEDKSVSTIFNGNPFNGYDGQQVILAPKPGDNLVVGTSGSGTFEGTEEVTFTVVNDASFWGLLTIVFESPTGAFPDYTVRMVFALPRVRLLSLGTREWAFNATSTAYKMLISKNNFGTDPDNSIVYSRGFTITHDTGSGDELTGNAASKLADADIFISTYDCNGMNSTQRNTRINFMNAGGVFLSFLETSAANIRDFARAVIPGGSAIAGTTTGTNGAAYRLTGTVDDIIINGPFGDLRNKIWGEDAGGTTSLTGFPAGSVTSYSNGVNIITHSSAGSGASYSTMLKMENDVSYKYSTDNTTTRGRWFHCGDGGYLAAASNSQNQDPFLLDSNNRPASKAYGTIQAGFLLPTDPSNTAYTSNSALFGNIMLWAISQIDYSQKVWNDR